MRNRKKRFWETSIFSQLARLKEPVSWFPYPALISIVLVLLFTGHLIPKLNPRLGNPADILPFTAPPAEEGPIWLSVSLINQKVIVTSDNREVFTWDAWSRNVDTAKPLIDFLHNRIKNITLSTSLRKKANSSESLVILAVDQGLKYLHLKLILYALASAGISEYAFETRKPF